MSDHKTPLELVEEVRSLVYICAGCQSCEFVGGHLLGPVPIGQITALCSAVESQAAEIERLRKALREIYARAYYLAIPAPESPLPRSFASEDIAADMQALARAALEVKP